MTKLIARGATAALVVAFAGQAGATEWNVSVWGKRREFTEHIEKIAELVEQKTDGEFTMNISYGGLSANTENLAGISIGAFEMAQICAGYHPDKNPAITVLELPFLGVKNLEEEIAVSQAVYDTEAAKDDMAQWNAKLLMPSPMPQYNLVGTGDPRRTLADFEGMRVRATGGMGQAFSEVGAVPTSVTSAEAYNAMESGVVDTVAFAPHAHLSFRTIDEADWWSENLNPGTVNCPVVVNIDAYEMLTDQEREALDGSVEESLDYYVETYAKLMQRWEDVLAEKEIEKVVIDEAELKSFRDSGAAPVREAWLADMERRGIPGQELIDLVETTLEEERAGQ